MADHGINLEVLDPYPGTGPVPDSAQFFAKNPLTGRGHRVSADRLPGTATSVGGGTTTLVASFPVTSSGAFTATLPTGATRALQVTVLRLSAYGYEPEEEVFPHTVWAYNAFTRALTIPAYHLASGDTVTVTVLYGTGASAGNGNAVIQLS